jgi:hypothetical protein
MNKASLVFVLTFSVVITACGREHVSAVNETVAVAPQPITTVTPIADTQPIERTSLDRDENIGNEITACSPEKVYRGESFKVSFVKSHGKNFAIYHEKTREFYFLTANDKYYFPFISPDEFKKMTEVEFDTTKVTNESDEVDGDGYYKPKPYFTKTGWYRVIIGQQALDVDFIDMPVTGSCRIYYINKKRPRGQ